MRATRMNTNTGTSQQSRRQDIPDEKKLQRFSLTKQQSELKDLIVNLVGTQALDEDKPNNPPKGLKPADALQKKLASIHKYLRMINGGVSAESKRDQHITKRIKDVSIMEIKVQLSSDSAENSTPKRGPTIRQSLN